MRCGVTRVHVQDPALTAAAERHPAASVQHDDGRCVDHFRGVGHDDGDRVRPAVEGDEATLHRSSGNISEAARSLGLTRRGLYLKLRRLGFEAEPADTK